MPARARRAAAARVRRLAYALCYAALVVTGRAAARLAYDFRILGSFGRRFGPVSILLQLPVLACWLLVRPISLAAFAACRALAPGSTAR